MEHTAKTRTGLLSDDGSHVPIGRSEFWWSTGMVGRDADVFLHYDLCFSYVLLISMLSMRASMTYDFSFRLLYVSTDMHIMPVWKLLTVDRSLDLV